MKRVLLFMIGLSLAGVAPAALAHEGDAARDHGGAIDAHATEAGNHVEGSVLVRGTVATLKADLYRIEGWPRVFSDARAMKRNADGTWSLDFQRFGHPHDFRVTRTPTGVLFELAAKDHGSARLEYTLEPIDAMHSKLTVRLDVPTPPTFTTEQALAMLRGKAQSDLDDFAKHANAR